MQDMPSMNRRTFVKSTGALGALAAVGGAAATGANLFGATEPALAESEEKITWGHCAINCPGRCSLKFHVKDDEVVWVDTCTSKDAGFDDPQPRACLRGRTYRRWMNHPDRINYPMKRVGKRGEGKFERISWDRLSIWRPRSSKKSSRSTATRPCTCRMRPVFPLPPLVRSSA